MSCGWCDHGHCPACGYGHGHHHGYAYGYGPPPAYGPGYGRRRRRPAAEYAHVLVADQRPATFNIGDDIGLAARGERQVAGRCGGAVPHPPPRSTPAPATGFGSKRRVAADGGGAESASDG